MNALTMSLVILLVLSRGPVLSEATRSRAIAEYINDGLLFVERDSIVFANSLAKAIIRDADADHLSTLQPEIQTVLDQIRLSPAPVPYETMINGRKRHFFVSRKHLPGAKPQRQKHVFVFQDVTFLRENEEAKVTFIGTLSHEIKTPITSLTMALGMLERMGYDAELVRIANADVARLRRLLEDLLNVSRLKIVRNPGSLDKQETNFSALVHQAIKGALGTATEKGVRIKAALHPQKPLLTKVDPTKISWVLSTLLADAVRQTPAGGQIDVELKCEGTRAQLAIDYERKFDSLGPAGHAIVRDIVEAHAGSFISSHESENKSTFKLTLHAELQDAATSAKKPLKQKDAAYEANLTG